MGEYNVPKLLLQSCCIVVFVFDSVSKPENGSNTNIVDFGFGFWILDLGYLEFEFWIVDFGFGI